MSTQTLAPGLEKGELILVTGATGLIGAHTVEKALQAGLRVRATARTEAKAQLLEAYFTPRYGQAFETCIMPDMRATDAYEQAIKGVQGVAHIASVLTFSPDWDKVVPPSVEGAMGLLRAAAKTPSVRRVVLTSSSFAATYSEHEVGHEVTTSSWNDKVVEPAKTNHNPKDVYAASKVLAEQEAWQFMKDHHPHFTLTTICPNVNWGPTHPAATSYNTNLVLYQAAQGDLSRLTFEGPQWMVNVLNTASIHVAALNRSDVGNERILAFTAPYTYRTVCENILRVRPDCALKDGQWQQDPNVDLIDLNRVHNGRFVELIGRDDLIDYPTSVRQALESEPEGWKAI